MKKKIIANEIEYELINDYKEGFDTDSVVPKITDYFEPYDYIVGDWAYGKLRLKGFCEKNNKIYNQINDYVNAEKYIKDNCSYECRYFILRKINNM
ncbi:MAG: YutD-like domain-containing protein [Ignavibacteriales bacterium]